MSRSPAADLAPLIKLLQAGVPPNRAAGELSRVLALWTAELKDDGEQFQERLSGLAEQMTTGIEEMHEGIAEASDKGKPTLRRILATHEAVLDGVRKAQGGRVVYVIALPWWSGKARHEKQLCSRSKPQCRNAKQPLTLFNSPDLGQTAEAGGRA